MTQKKFATIHLSDMTIDNLYTLIDKTIEAAKPLQAKMNPLTKKSFDFVKEDKAKFEKWIKKNKEKILIPELKSLDKTRKDSFLEINRFISDTSNNTMSVIQIAGMRFHTFMKPYRHTCKSPLNAITGTLEEIFDRYHADALLRADAKTIGIESQVNICESANTEYNVLYRKHNAEIETKLKKPASEIKKEVIKSYKNFCMLVEQSANLTLNTEVEMLFQEMNDLRKKHIL